MALAAGSRIGPYEITGPLGVGGMGEVYRAHDSRLNRDVAIKTLPAGFASDPSRMARFEREAQALAALNHPNIAMIFGIEEDALVMELVQGSTLAERIAVGLMPLDEAVAIARQMVDALEAAHEKGIVHRDLKPANVKITPEGNVKVLDFGLAKAFDSAPAGGGPSSSPALTVTIGETRPGMILGTPAYMAPEQARGQTVDRRVDIWAFGVVLFEMLSGHGAFHGESLADLVTAVLGKEPDWSAIPSTTPARIRELLRLCLARDKKARLQAIGDARIFLNAPPEDIVPIVVAPKPQVLPWAVAGLLALCAGVALWAPWRGPPSAMDRPFVQLDLETAPDQPSEPAISPDGTRIVFVSKGHLVLRRLDEGKNIPLADTGDASSPFFSPDGRWVAFFAHRKLQKIAVDGGAPVTLCDAVGFGGGTWGTDNNIVAAVGSDELSQVSAAGGTPRPFTDSKADTGGTAMHLWPQALPDGKGILYGASNGTWQGSLRVLTPHNGLKTVIENSTHGRYLAGGYLVYHQRGTLFAAPMDLGRLQLTGPAVPLVDEVSFSDTRAEFDVSASGTLVYYRSTSRTNLIPSWVYSSGKSEPLIKTPGNYVTPRLSPDGKRLALSVVAEGKQNLWVYDIGRETPTRLTSGAEPDLFPVWTPDGEFLAFRSGNTLAWTRSDGSGKLERQAVLNGSVAPRSFSPDGKWLAFWPVGPRSDVWIVPVERAAGTLRLGVPQKLWQRAADEGGPTISPDGRWVAYTSDESGPFQIYVRPFAPGSSKGGKWLVSDEGGHTPLWANNGRDLFYQVGRRVMLASYKVQGDSFVAEKPHLWSERRLGDVGFFPGFDVAPDGTRVLGLLAPEDARPETSLRVLLNLGNELHRRTSTNRDR